MTGATKREWPARRNFNQFGKSIAEPKEARTMKNAKPRMQNAK
jgi:hypothetical protein